MTAIDDAEQSFEILEDDGDRTYIPNRRSITQEDKLFPDTGRPTDARAEATVRQRPPLLIVEQPTTTTPVAQTLPDNAGAAPLNIGLPLLSAPEPAEPAALATSSPKMVNKKNVIHVVAPAVPSINFVGEARKVTETADWMQIISYVIQFFAMALTVFVLLVLINPPFVQPKCVLVENPLILQTQPASLQKAAILGALAGGALLLAPILANIYNSRFFPGDLASAVGLYPQRSTKKEK